MTEFDSMDAVQRYGAVALRGKLVRFRALDDADLDTLADWWKRPEWAVLQQAYIKPRPDQAIREQFRSWSTNDKASGVGFSVVDADEALVGHVTVFGVSAVERVGTLAVMIGPDFVGRGLGTDATRLAVRYAFDEMGVHKLELRVWAHNERALRTYRGAGFVEEGRRREVGFHVGAYHDEILMGLLESEYRAARRLNQAAG